MMDWMKLIVSVLAGLGAAIPLVIELVNYVKQATNERNWAAVLKLVMAWMAEAEKKFSDGASRKEWVMSMVVTSADTINYPLDNDAIAKISATIDEICAASKVLNTGSKAVVSANAE